MTFDLAQISAGLKAAGLIDQLPRQEILRAVVVSPPGTGKTTVVPPAVANLVSGRVVVTQPRRMAARAAARRLAQLTGTQVGELAGFTVRGARKVSAHTRVEFVTNGVLLRRLMADPELSGVSAVIMDEVHERQLDGDLLAGMVDQLTQLRELHWVMMSATVAAEKWAGLYEADVFEISDVLHPVEELWAPAPVRAVGTRGVDREFLAHVADQVRQAAATTSGDVLVFLPGAREISAVQQQVPGALALLGSTPAAEQDAILRPADQQRVILSTNVAESALTVPGVDTVVDAGLDRQLRLDSGRNMTGLVTVGAAKASMVQRAGRAGRLGPGRVIRCMDSAEFAARPEFSPPEIATSELTGPVLDLACWGAPGGAGLRLPDPLPGTAYRLAVETLQGLGALKGEAPTQLGHEISTVPADPRLARALIEGAELVGTRAAAESVAVLNSELREVDASKLLRELRRRRDQVFIDDVNRFTRLAPDVSGPGADEQSLGLITALAYPDRVARVREDGSEYLMASGTAVQTSDFGGAQWLAVSEVSVAGSRAVVRRAVVIDPSVAELAVPVTNDVTAQFSGGQLSARRRQKMGAIILNSTPIPATSAEAGEAVEAAVADAVSRSGWKVLRPSEEFQNLLRRLEFVAAHHDWAAVPEVSQWAGYELRKVAEGKRADLTTALKTWVGWEKMPELDRLAPERLPIPSGRDAVVQYSGAEAVLAVKLQEMFGQASTPEVGGVAVTVHLLSPAGRELAITQDLSNFWNNVYPQVRAENRARYAKHPWPEDPLSATATGKTKRAEINRGKNRG